MMIQASRRSFLKGVMALAVVSAVGIPEAHSAPVIIGDGIHDDTDGIQALIDGKPVSIEGDTFTVSGGWVEGGTFRISRTVHFEGHCKATFYRCKFIMPGMAAENPMFFIHRGASGGGISHSFLDRA